MVWTIWVRYVKTDWQVIGFCCFVSPHLEEAFLQLAVTVVDALEDLALEKVEHLLVEPPHQVVPCDRHGVVELVAVVPARAGMGVRTIHYYVRREAGVSRDYVGGHGG